MFKFKHAFLAILVQLPLLVFGFTTTSEVIGNLPLDQNPNLSTFFPQNLKHVSEVLISRPEYVLSFNSETRLLNWAAWKLEASDIGHIGRSNKFIADADLQNYLNKFNKQAILPSDYFESCFDRGHQVPSADRDITVEINQITFFMSNMIPQTASLNRYVWAHLESFTRDLVVNQNKKVYIIAGPIFDEDFGKIGPNKDIPVPSKNFKMLVVLEKDQTLKDINLETKIISVIMPNVLRSGERPLDNKTQLCEESKFAPKPPSPPSPAPSAPIVTPEPHPLNDDWKKFEVPISEIERLSGFKIVPDNQPIENLK